MNSRFSFDEKLKKNDIGSLNLQIPEYDYIIGVDEAGRGPGAGGVFAAAVCFNSDINYSDFDKLNDSKKISEKTREELFKKIKEQSVWSVACVEVNKIEEINILNSALLAMNNAVLDVVSKLQNVDNKKILILVDGNKKIKFLKDFEQETIVKGDFKSASIAAASILAKVSRDNYMYDLDLKYPNYNFRKNKGYLTAEHINAIKEFGACSVHRKSFLKNIL